MKYPALFLLVVVASLGCTIICGCQRPPEDGAVELYRKYFEAGRRSEIKGNLKIAGDSYDYLIKCGSFYGEYGLAQLQLRREPGSIEAVKHLLSCAQRTSDISNLFPVSVEETAFSVAAMAKLSDIAVSEHDRTDVAEWLRSRMSDAITQNVRDWAWRMKADADSATIYKDILFAVESCRPSRRYVKTFKWDEVSKVLKDGGRQGSLPSSHPSYKVVKFNKVQGATYRYDFEVRLSGNGTFDVTDKVKSAIRRQLMKEFLAANGYDGADNVRISFPFWRQQESAIVGSVVAFKMSVVRGEYDEATGRGKIVVRLDGRDMKAAREWTRENIAELVADKNVTLVAGKSPPPGAHYKIGSERITQDALLEVEFSMRD